MEFKSYNPSRILSWSVSGLTARTDGGGPAKGWRCYSLFDPPHSQNAKETGFIVLKKILNRMRQLKFETSQSLSQKRGKCEMSSHVHWMCVFLVWIWMGIPPTPHTPNRVGYGTLFRDAHLFGALTLLHTTSEVSHLLPLRFIKYSAGLAWKRFSCFVSFAFFQALMDSEKWLTQNESEEWKGVRYIILKKLASALKKSLTTNL